MSLAGNNWEDLFLTDIVAIKLTGFDYRKNPSLKNVFSLNGYPIIKKDAVNNLKIIYNNRNLNNIGYKDINLNLDFHPPKGWSVLQDNYL